jgi:hypothetical protein
MQAWIVKHVREQLYFCPDEATRTKIDRRPMVFWSAEGADISVRRMQVPADWKVVEVEITEK